MVCREEWRDDGAGVLGSERFGDALAFLDGMMVVECCGCGQTIEKWMLRVKWGVGTVTVVLAGIVLV